MMRVHEWHPALASEKELIDLLAELTDETEGRVQVQEVPLLPDRGVPPVHMLVQGQARVRNTRSQPKRYPRQLDDEMTTSRAEYHGD